MRVRKNINKDDLVKVNTVNDLGVLLDYHEYDFKRYIVSVYLNGVSIGSFMGCDFVFTVLNGTEEIDSICFRKDSSVVFSLKFDGNPKVDFEFDEVFSNGLINLRIDF